MSNIVEINGQQVVVPDYAKAATTTSDFGRAGGFPTISMYKGTFQINRGDQKQRVASPLPVIILGVTPKGLGYNRAYYIGDYVPGQAEAPDCSSSDGITPDAGDVIQAPLCAQCAHSQWGSKGKGQACAQGKTLYVVPASAPTSEIYQIRVAPTSLKPVAVYGQRLAQLGVNPSAVITNVGQLSEEEMLAKGIDYPILKLDFGGFLQPDVGLKAIARAASPEILTLIKTVTALPAPAAPQAPLPPPAPPVEAPLPAFGEVASAPPAPPVEAPLPAFGEVAAQAPAPQQAPPAAPAVPAQAPAPKPPQSATQPKLVDAAGVEWDANLHSSGKSFVKDGTWKKRKGAPAETPASQAPPQQTPAATPDLANLISTWGTPQ